MTKLLLLLFTGAKFGKLLLTGGSMLVSVFAYALLFGWRYAVGFVLLLFVHEMGHYIAARQRGLDVGAPTFIPFVGAWVELKDMPHDAETEAYVGLGGPLLGTVGALACYFIARDQGSNLLLAIAYSGFFPQPLQSDPALALRRRADHRGAVAAHLVAGSSCARGFVLLAAESPADPDGRAGRAAVAQGDPL
jgi:Zn-dependent protease